MGQQRWSLVLGCALAAVVGAAVPAQEAKATGEVRALLELSQEFYYAGDPLAVRISIGNEGAATVANPVRSPLFAGFRLSDERGETIAATGKASVDEPSRPEKLSPNGFYGAVVDVTEIFPEIRAGGRFQIRWSGDGIESRTIAIQVIPKYDPSKEYRATIETDQGPIVIEFLPEASPIAVKAFIDMANTGTYDGLLFHEVHVDDYVVAGSPAASGVERPVFSFPAEQSTLPVVAGTVLLRPVSAAPPANSSPFVIVLRAHPEWRGQATVLGQVVSGLDTVKTISRLPNSATATKPFFKPLKDVRIVGVRVEEKTPPGAPAGP